MENLPKRSETHIQEERSRKAFRKLVPDHLFVIRDQFENDYGVDCIIELVTLSGHITNYQCQVQLKSIKNGKVKADDSLSHIVPVKTINYLINQPNSLFIVYLENRDIFYWEWTDIINNYFSFAGEDLRKTRKRYVSYRFTKKLNEETIKDIYQHILSRSEMINDFVHIVNVSSNLPIILSVDGKESKIIDSGNVEQNLINYGIALCNKEEYKTLSKWIQQLPVSAKENPKLALVVSYFMTHVGNYLNALSWLPRGKKIIGFDNEELFIADYLDLAIQRALGLISYEEYNTKLKVLSDKAPEDLLSLQAALDYHKYKLAANRILDDSLIENFYKIIEKIKGKPNLNPLILAETELVEFSVEGLLIFQELIRTNFKLAAHHKLNYKIAKVEIEQNYNDLKNRLEKWTKGFSDKILDNTVPTVIRAKYILEFTHDYALILETPKVLEEEFEFELTAEDMKSLNDQIGNLEWAIRVFDNKGLLIDSLRAKLAEAGIHKRLGNVELHNEILKYIIEKANEIGLSDMAKGAEDILMNREILDDAYHTTSEERHRIHAIQFIQAFDLPEDRFDNVYKEYWWVELDHQERKSWCEYIETIQDLTHTLSKATKYAYDPKRLIRCSKFNYESIKPGYEREILIADFKSRFCATCKERKPKM